MKDYQTFPPIEIIRATGSYLHLKEGGTLIDAISSWWCKTLGHGHPRLRAALMQQMDRFEHVILANTTHDLIVKLSERLARLAPGLNRVFYAGDGSSAVEVAVKMALHSNKLAGREKATRFMAFENGYHGETALTLALGDQAIYSDAYRELMPPVTYLRGLPYVDSIHHPLWRDCGEVWPALEAQLEKSLPELAGIVFEPILQGAGGMRIYSADFLRRLRDWTREHQVLLIADEILSGYGRTGTMLASEQAAIIPDLVCLSKGLTAGWMPMSAVLISEEIYQRFYADYGQGRDFLHSNTFCGNALGAAVALETLNIYQEENILGQVNANAEELRNSMQRVSASTGRLKNLRSIGAMVAADLQGPGTGPGHRAGFSVFQAAIARGALLRTLGDTVYWLLPLNVEKGVVEDLEKITQQAIQAALTK